MPAIKFLNPHTTQGFYPPNDWLTRHKLGLTLEAYSKQDIKDLRNDFKHSYTYDDFWFVRDYFCPYCECSSSTPGHGSFPKLTFSNVKDYEDWFCKEKDLDLGKNPNDYSDEEIDLLEELNRDCDAIECDGSIIRHGYIPCLDDHQLCWFLGDLPETWYEKTLNCLLAFFTKISGHHHIKAKKGIWTSFWPVFAVPLCLLHDFWNKQLGKKLEK